MARFYARFDSGSAGWSTALDSVSNWDGYFDRRYISANSSSAALLRDGLIQSRSAVSADVYQDLDSGNQDGSKGIYFPPDSGPFSTNNSTFVSWSNAYTSSVDGIKTPVTNEYGVSDSINFSKRPTASVLSTYTNLVGPANPVDSIGVSYLTYRSASIAVKAVLDAISGGGPYARLGNFPSRTLHSIWHDPNLQYFAWDDFTPGTPQSYSVTDPSNINDEYYYTDYSTISFGMSWALTQYKADEIARPVVSGVFHTTGSSTPVDSLASTILASGSIAYTWSLSLDPMAAETVGPARGEYQIDTSVKLRDGKLYSQGINSDGTAATTTDSNLLKLTKLYPYDLAFSGTAHASCFDFGPLTASYATVAEPNNLVGQYVYTTTNTSTPSTSQIGYYYDGAFSGTVYQVDGAGAALLSYGSCTGGGQGTTTTTTSTTSTTTQEPQ